MSAPGSDRADTVRAAFWAGCNVVTAVLLFALEATLWLCAFIVLPLLIAGFVYLIISAIVSPPSSYYSISARSETAALSLPLERETTWRIEGAILCSTVEFDGLVPITGEDSPCGSRRWHAYTAPDPREQVLVIGGGEPASGQEIEVAMETREDRGLQVSLRSAASARNLGMLRLVGEDIVIPPGAQLNLVWVGNDRPRDLVFPFTANRVRIGRDVTWSDSSTLYEGKIEIFTASGENLSKRTRVEEAELLPGDQVRLQRFEGENPLQPKGFLRFNRLQPGESPSALTAVAFGRADSIDIERFGDSGYSFRPRWWVGILQNRLLVILSAIIAGLIGVLGGYNAIRDFHARSTNQAWKSLRARGAGRSEALPSREEDARG